MMKKKTLIKAVPVLLMGMLTACQGDGNALNYLTKEDEGTATVRIAKSEDSTSTGRYLSPKEVKVKFTYNDLSGTLSNNENVCPSVGDVNILVVPVHLPGSRFNTDQVRNDIEEAFFGSGGRNGYLSLKDFFYRSSFGKLNFSGLVTDWFDVTEHTSIETLDDITMGQTGSIVSDILPAAVDWAVETYDIDLKDYDKNQDGSIDAVWMVYDHYNYFNQAAVSYGSGVFPDNSDLNEAFWNYTSWDWSTSPDLETPTTSAFSWASFDQLYLGYCDYETRIVSIEGYEDFDVEMPLLNDLVSIKLDTHTFIHETGHLLGLEDFYSSTGPNPAGSSTMMDQNVGDFDQYSKMLLGWVTPYVVYGSSEILLTDINHDDHSLIVIPSNYDEISAEIERASNNGTLDDYVYEFNPFSEYILIDLYSPLGIESYDIDNPIVDRGSPMDETGVRIYHVDSRIFKCRVINYDGGQNLYYDEDDLTWDGEMLANNEAILMPISNSMVESSSYQLDESYDYFDQIRLLESSGINTFDSGEYADASSTLWGVDDDPFEIASFGYQFFNGRYTYNDGTDMPWRISVTSLVEATK